MNSVAQQCIALLAKQKGIAPDRIAIDSTFEELGLDSLDRVSAVFDIEDTFDIEIADGQLQQIRCVRDMVAGIEMALQQKWDPTPSCVKTRS